MKQIFSKQYKGRDYVFEFKQNDYWHVSFEDHETMITCLMIKGEDDNWMMKGSRLSDVVLQPQFNEWIKEHHRRFVTIIN